MLTMQKKDTEIIIFDPDDFYITMVDLLLDSMGLKLTGSAYNLETSTNLVNRILKKEVKPDIAIIESHMGKSEFDGDKIATELRKLVPNIKIIGFSTYETPWADVQALKTLKDMNATIIKAITQLTGVEYSTENTEDPSD